MGPLNSDASPWVEAPLVRDRRQSFEGEEAAELRERRQQNLGTGGTRIEVGVLDKKED